jgi:hypothetical protein
VAALLFVTLPRLRASVMIGPSLGSPFASAGFSDTVALGDLGRIRRDPRVVLRVETLAGDAPDAEEAYWRGLAFDRFDGAAWSVTRPERRGVSGSAEGGVRFGAEDESPELVQRIVREPVASSVLFAAGKVRELHGTVRRLERDRHGSIFAAGQDDERLRYVVRSRAAAPRIARCAATAPSGCRARHSQPRAAAALGALPRRRAGAGRGREAGQRRRARARDRARAAHTGPLHRRSAGPRAGLAALAGRGLPARRPRRARNFASAMVLVARVRAFRRDSSAASRAAARMRSAASSS